MALRDSIRRFVAKQERGRDWQLFRGDEHVCDIVEPVRAETFWLSYRVVPRIDPDRLMAILRQARVYPRVLHSRSPLLPGYRGAPWLAEVDQWPKTGRVWVRESTV